MFLTVVFCIYFSHTATEKTKLSVSYLISELTVIYTLFQLHLQNYVGM